MAPSLLYIESTEVGAEVLPTMEIIFDDPCSGYYLALMNNYIPLRYSCLITNTCTYAPPIFFERNVPFSMEPLCSSHDQISHSPLP